MSSYSDKSKYWERAILLVDMNAFFASVEQRDFPELKAKPVAVTNGRLGSCIITSSYEARAQGIKTGMRLKEAQLKCPELIQCPARPKEYAATSKAIMAALAENISPYYRSSVLMKPFWILLMVKNIWGNQKRLPLPPNRLFGLRQNCSALLAFLVIKQRLNGLPN